MPQVEIPQQSQLYFALSGATVGIVYSITDKNEKIGNNFTTRSMAQNESEWIHGDQNDSGNNFTTRVITNSEYTWYNGN